MSEQHKQSEKHWYYISTWYCPLCGKEDTIRTRKYTPRPKEYENRHEYEEHWDYCNW